MLLLKRLVKEKQDDVSEVGVSQRAAGDQQGCMHRSHDPLTVMSKPCAPPLSPLQWDLVCDRASLNNIGSSIYMFGLLVGAVGFGSLADK